MNTRILVILVAIFFFSCKKESDNSNECGPLVRINEAAYNSVATGNYNITKAAVNGNCLEISIAASGCSGNTWVTELVDAANILKSDPPLRLLRLKLTNTELCTAVPVKSMSFDITALRVAGEDEVILILEGYSGSLIYKY